MHLDGAQVCVWQELDAGSAPKRGEPSSIWIQRQVKTHSKHHNDPDYDSFVILLKAPIRRCINSGDKLAYMVSKTELGKLSWYGAKCAKKISPTPLNQPERQILMPPKTVAENRLSGNIFYSAILVNLCKL